MDVQFVVTTKIQEYTAVLKNISADEHALLVHLKYKLEQAYENSDYEDDISYSLNVIRQ